MTSSLDKISFKRAIIKLTITILSFTFLIGCSSVNKIQEQLGNSQGNASSSANNMQNSDRSISASSTVDSKLVVYINNQYGFNFLLPQSWKGYSIVTSNWKGTDIKSGNIIETGSVISIRHPKWTSSIPRQDIPIMIFTLAQWELVRQEKLAVSSAPIGPSELGRNSKYVFALPARYNFAYPIGFEEVEKILEGKPFKATEFINK